MVRREIEIEIVHNSNSIWEFLKILNYRVEKEKAIVEVEMAESANVSPTDSTYTGQ